MPHVLVLTPQPDEYLRLIAEATLPELQVVASADVADGLARGGHSSILLGDPTRVKAALPHLPQLVWTQLTWAGVEPMLDPSLRRDYVLTNIRGVFGPLMSEFVFGYLLLFERQMLSRLEAQRECRWDTTLPGTLRGRTLGLVGVGSIGAHLAGTARHFGMRVHGYTRSSRDCAHVDQYFHGADRMAFARAVDYLVITVPNTSETRALVDAEMLGALPPHAVVINVGRGRTVDEAALAEALQQQRLGGAVLDVFSEEPLPPTSPFWTTPNTFITGHTSAPSFPRDIVGVFADNYRRFRAGQPLQHRVDFAREY
jgi:phosphoglycerate dehydrogenase-like enzyme